MQNIVGELRGHRLEDRKGIEEPHYQFYTTYYNEKMLQKSGSNEILRHRHCTDKVSHKIKQVF